MLGDKDFIQFLCDLEVPSVIKLSPDSQAVLYSTELLWGRYKGKYPVSTLWFAATGQANSSRQLTSGGYKDYAPVWNPDGKSIAFISDRAKPGEKWAIYIQPLPQVEKAHPITANENGRAIEAFEFSPNGTHIAFLSADEKTTEQIYREPSWRRCAGLGRGVGLLTVKDCECRDKGCQKSRHGQTCNRSLLEPGWTGDCHHQLQYTVLGVQIP